MTQQGGNGNFRQPDFQNIPAGANARGSLDGHMLGALRHMSDQLGNILALNQRQIQIAQEVPNDVGGTLSGEAITGTTNGGSYALGNANPSLGWTTIASVKGQAPRYRSVFLSRGNDLLYSAAAIGRNTLGVVAKMRFTSQDNAQYTVLFDIPSNGIVHAACVSQNVDIEIMTTIAVFQPGDLAALPAGYFDNPLSVQVDPTHSVNAQGQPISSVKVMGSITSDQALAPNLFNSATRHISTALAPAGGDQIPIPRGATAVTIYGPADVKAQQNTKAANVDVASQVPANVTALLANGTQTIGVSSTTGGLVTAIFTLGF